MTTRETVNARLEELEHGQEDHHARIAAMEAKPSTTGPPINEAGITATFAAIFARMDNLEVAQRLAAECMEAQAQRLDALDVHVDDLFTRALTPESARIAPRSAPEGAATASGVPMEPGNATRPLTLLDPHDKDGIVQTNANGVAAALRMYRKVQACKVVYDDVRLPNGTWSATAAGLLAWIKEGEA